MNSNDSVILTCAVTGANAAAVKKHPALPITPQQIAAAVIGAARAGATVAHVHVREPDTGAPSNRPELYREVVNRIRDSGIDIIINLTTGMDGEIRLDPHNPRLMAPDSTIKPPEERIRHIVECLPEMCTLDCGVMAFGGESIYVARHSDLAAMARIMTEVGVKPELEVFDLGQIENARKLINEGLISGTPLFQFCLGTSAGAPATASVMATMRELLPAGSLWAAFGVGPQQFPMVAQAVLMGGYARVGLEDNLRLSRGVYATNEQQVEKALGIIQSLGKEVVTPAQARQKLKLKLS
jgi:uncharacterized protein (DUF849 family)